MNDKEKQIEELAKICADKCKDCHNSECRKSTKNQYCIAETLYTAGYRKQKAIDEPPAADVVEVVRCKDCKYSADLGMSGIWCDHPDNRNPLGCRPTDYCNDGERRENT